MIRHLLKIAFRNLNRKRGYSILNIMGLTIGMACAMVIGLYVVQETSYEEGFTQSDDIYRVNTKFLNATRAAASSYNLLPVLSEQAEFKVVTNIRSVTNKSALLDGKTYPLKKYYHTDTAFHSIFDYDLLYGVAGSAFKNENSLILTATEAQKLFGREDVVGEFLMVEDQRLEVTAVLKPTFYKSHLEFNGLWIKNRRPAKNRDWAGIGYYTYVIPHRGVKPEQVNKRLEQIRKDYIFPGFGEAMGFYEGYSYEQWLESGSDISLFTQPIKEIHLSTGLGLEIATSGDAKSVWVFAITAAFVLIISCANFINLATARASERTKELGMKKVLGTSRKSLMLQILIESVVITFLAGIGSLALTELSLNLMDIYFPGFIALSLFQSVEIVPLLLAFVVFIGLVSGLYPAWYLSSFKITSLLKGQRVQGFSRGGVATVFRNVLVVIQFSLSAILIIGAMFIARQMDFMQQTDLGFEEENVLVIDKVYFLGKNKQAFLNELERLPFVDNASFHSRLPGASGNAFTTQEKLPTGGEIDLKLFEGSADQFETLGIQMVEGQSFSDLTAAEDIIINESAAKWFGDSTVLGSKISDRTIIGIVKDYHYASLREPIAPAWFRLNENVVEIAVKMPITAENLRLVEEKWQQFSQKSFEAYPLADNFKAILKEEGQLGKAFSLFTVLAIFIAGLGMYGLAVYTADQRSRELSIRKVLGASVANLLSLLVSNFFKLAVLALIIALPLSWLAVDAWLSDFAYRIEMSASLFVLGGASVLMIVVFTVIYQSYQAAVRNPAETLKSD